jgi:coenzyme F420-reducing hydrogenase beta subunit
MNSLLKTYLDNCKEEDTLPSGEGFVVFLMEGHKKNYKEAQELKREYKGLLNTYSIAFLKDKASKGGRHSGNYTTLLKELLNNDKLNGAEEDGKVEFILDIDLKDGEQYEEDK